jgi:hypothetical protein
MSKAVVPLLLGLALVSCGGGVTGPSAPPSAATTVAPPVPSPAPTRAGQTLTGVWRGVFIETIQGCVQDHAVQLDLTESGPNVSGSGVAVVGPRYCNDSVGDSFTLTVSGSVSGAAVLMRVVNVTAGGDADLTGTVSGNSMGGTYLTNERDTGTWSVTR